MSGFEQSQQDYYLRQINRSIPVTSRVADLGTIQAALGVVDPAMPEDTTATTDTVQFMSTFGRKTDAITRDAECRALPVPGDAMRPDAGARTGCGWWFVPDSGAPSVGAYGTRRGPMNPRIDEQFGAGQWLWARGLEAGCACDRVCINGIKFYREPSGLVPRDRNGGCY